MAFETPVYPLQPTFARGEVSPYLFGRVDLQTFASGLRTLRNGFVRPEGACSNRQGTQFTGAAITAIKNASIIVPFIFSATQSYVFEIGALSSQVFSAGSVVTVLGAAISNVQFTGIIGLGSNTLVTCATPHGLSLGQNVTIVGVIGTGAGSINGTWVVVAVGSPTTFQIATGKGTVGVYTGGGNIQFPASFATPWAAADLPLVRWSQSADTLTMVHPNYPTQEIKRTSANTFTCLPAVYTQGPFLQQNTDGVTFVYSSAISGTVTLTATAAIFNANMVGGLIQLTQQDLSTIPPWEPSKLFAGTGPSNTIGLYRRANFKNYKSVSNVNSGTGTVASGTWIPSHSQGTQPDGDGNAVSGLAASAGIMWQYQDSGFGVVKITGYTDSQHVTGVVQPNYTGGPSLLPPNVVGGPVTVVGPFLFSGTGVQTAFTPLTASTSLDPNKFYVTIGGVYQAPSNYTITGTGPGTINFVVAPPAGTNNISVTQITQLGQTTYWAMGAFSADQGYPSAVSYFPDRLVLAATPKQPVGVFGSQTSQYHVFGVSNPVVASDAFTVFLNARQLNAISDLIPLSDLLVGTSNIIWRLWAGTTGTAIGPLALAANPQSFYGACPTCASVLFGDSAIFAEYDGRRLRDLIYQFAYDKFLGQELTQYSRHLIPFGTQFKRLAYKPDPAAQFVFGLRTDGILLVCTYLREQQVIGWSHWDMAGGTVDDICVVPENNSFGLYMIVNRTINNVAVRYIEHLSQREVTTIYDYKFMDCCQTYDGRNTSSTTMQFVGGTTFLAGDTGSVVASSTAGWATFLSSDVGNEIWLYGTLNFQTSVGSMSTGTLQAAGQLTPGGQYTLYFPDGETRTATVGPDGVTITWFGVLNAGIINTANVRCRFLITAVSSSTNASVRLKDPCPPLMQAAATATWTFARVTISGATPLANAPVVALLDACAFGVSATGVLPNGSIVVNADGSINLPVAAGVAQVGLQYLFDFETLPLNMQGQETIRMRAKENPVIYLDVWETRNFLAGTDFTTAIQHTERAFESYTSPTQIQQGAQWARVNSELDSECHTCIRQNMPLPITIRMQIPQVEIGEPIS
jgi:hypothetical protein